MKSHTDGEKAPEENMWVLNVDEKIKNKTWWWWWWIFFIKNPQNPAKPKQLMILWSTKNCDSIKVNDFPWKRRKPVTMTGEAHAMSGAAHDPLATDTAGKDDERTSALPKGHMDFNGMTAVWYFDGETMTDPLLLKDSNFTSSWEGTTGELKPFTDEDLRYFGSPEQYTVKVQSGDLDMTFEMTPLPNHASDTHFKKNHYFRNYGYSIQKIYNTALRGSIVTGEQKEDIEGTAYFQKVMVNAPTVPWYWGILHCEDGSFFDYFMPHIGFDILRKKETHDTFLNRWNRVDWPMNRSARYYDIKTGEIHKFDRLWINRSYKDDLPTFDVRSLDRKTGATLNFTLEAYSRALWRFEQKHFKIFKSILYYNEYPVIPTAFEMKLPDGRIKTLDDIGYTVGNCEHAWGKLW